MSPHNLPVSRISRRLAVTLPWTVPWIWTLCAVIVATTLASSPMTFLVIDPDLRLIDYGEVGWSQVNGQLAYKFYPELLHPIHCVLGDDEFSAHLTPQGDLIFIFGRYNLIFLAGNRQGEH